VSRTTGRRQCNTSGSHPEKKAGTALFRKLRGGGWFFDLCHVFSIPLALKLSASFSQLQNILRLLNSLGLADY